MIILTFDDNYISEWAGISPWMRQRGMKATFYVSNVDRYSPAEFRHLRILEEAGHEIGYHGLNHSRAGLAGKPVDRRNPKLEGEREYRSLGEYIEKEITAGLEILDREGIRPRHFSYPFGNQTPETDRAMLKIFDSVRRGGMGSYPEGRPIPEVWAARNFDCSKNDFVLSQATDRTIGLLMHTPTPGRLQKLADFTERNGTRFLTVTEARTVPMKGKS